MGNANKRLKTLKKALRRIVAYPSDGHPRRDAYGYPREFTYDRFSYNRMVDEYRAAISKALKAAERKEPKQ